MTSQDRFNTASPPPDANGEPAGVSTSQLIANLKQLAAELVDYAGYYLSAKADGIKWSVTKLVLLAAIGLIAALALGGAVVTGVVLALVGMANGIALIFEPDLRWLAWLITGVVVLAIVFGGALLGMKMMQRSMKRKTEQKYEARRKRQQSEFGHHVRSRAAD